MTEPLFGDDISETFPEESGYQGKVSPAVTVTFPAWCKVVVKRRMADGQIAEFAATERWKENYATAGKNSKQPNSMWMRRPYAQLAKCAEAQALRKAFPEFGSQPTADEMEGKEIDMGTVDRSTGEVTPAPKQELPPCPQEDLEAQFPKWRDAIAAGKKTPQTLLAFTVTRYTLTDQQKAQILALKATDAAIDTEFTKQYEDAEQ